jgi:hypothetical protein
MDLVPRELLDAAGERLGSRIVSCERLLGGFSGNVNCLLGLADGRRAVMKTALEGDIAVQHGISWTSIIEREIWMYRNLAGTERYRPAFYGEARGGGRLGMLIEYLGDATIVPPWTDEAIEATARGLAELHHLPRPENLPPDILRRTVRQPYLEQIAERKRYPGRLTPAYATCAWWDWFEAVTPKLSAAYEGFFGPLPYGLCHNDVRSDNMFIRNGAPLLLDWNQVVWGTPARDSVYWAVGVEREGGGRAPGIFRRYLAAGGFDPGEAAIRGTLAWWLVHSIDRLQDDTQPLSGLLLRIDQLPALLRWLVELMDLPAPPVGL